MMNFTVLKLEFLFIKRYLKKMERQVTNWEKLEESLPLLNDYLA